MAYVFITDAFSRRIVGWQVAANMRTDMVLDAFEMARWSRGTHLEGLVAHSDAGSEPRSATANAWPNSERHHRSAASEIPSRPAQGPWKTIEDVELATLAWVHWHNTERLQSYLDDTPPAEFEDAYYRDLNDDNELVGIQ